MAGGSRKERLGALREFSADTGARAEWLERPPGAGGAPAWASAAPHSWPRRPPAQRRAGGRESEAVRECRQQPNRNEADILITDAF